MNIGIEVEGPSEGVNVKINFSTSRRKFLIFLPSMLRILIWQFSESVSFTGAPEHLIPSWVTMPVARLKKDSYVVDYKLGLKLLRTNYLLGFLFVQLVLSGFLTVRQFVSKTK